MNQLIKFPKSAIFLVFCLFFISCNKEKEMSSINPVNWKKRMIKLDEKQLLKSGETYLSVYSEIYSINQSRTHNLTGTISLRNIDRNNRIYISKAEYFDTSGKLIRRYFDKDIYIDPLETIEIIIDRDDESGGSGGNFIFEWKIPEKTNEPLFEGVMVLTSGTQGLSFTTQGKKIINYSN